MVKPNITPKEFEDSLLEEGITEETEATPVEDIHAAQADIPEKQDTTPEFLTTEEEEHDKHLEETLGWSEEE